MSLKLRDQYTFDQISLGEVMLRLDPGETRIRTARQFSAWEGGGEYNTSRGLRKCFGLKTAVCTALVDNEVEFFESRKYPELEILDRVGGGDSFAGGLAFGFLEFNDPQKAVEYGAAHGAFASTTPGDTSMATRKEVEKLMAGGGARVVR